MPHRVVRLLAVAVVAASAVAATPAGAAPDRGAKVIGGQPAGPGWSEVVFIEVDRVFGCTGTLIAPTWVLTAAHCIGSEAVVYGGSSSFAGFTWSIPALGGHAHPRFGFDTYGYDYGLYELSEPAFAAIDVELADGGDADLWQPGTELYVLGFGLTDGLVPSDQLRIGSLVAQDDQLCQGMIGPVYDASTMLCLYGDGVSGCSGDSGGPIFGLDGSRMRLVGIVSFGPPECDSVSVGAWVPAEVAWIEELTGVGGGDEAESPAYRVAGVDRYDTAAAVASAWTTADVVYVATGENYPDSLAAGPAAARSQAPILLVTRDSIPPVTARELQRLQPAIIVVVGGSAAISEAVVDGLRSYAPSVDRIAGATRVDTAVALVQAAFPPAEGAARVWLAPSTSFADPLIAASAAAVHGEPLLLTAPGGGLDFVVWDAVRRLGPSEVRLVGDGEFTASPFVAELELLATVTTTAGADAYARGANLWPDFGPGTPIVVLTTGENFPDALVGAAYAALAPPSPLLLTPRACLPPPVADELDRLAPEAIVILGGPAAVGADVERLVRC